jgi:hypothetical protein
MSTNNNLFALIKICEDMLCRNLFALLRSESLLLYAGALRVVFLLFESQMPRLKFQLKHFLTILMEVFVPCFSPFNGV